MSKTTIKSNRLISVLLCSLFLPISSCVNKLDSETSPGTTPITFSTKINKTSTRVTNTTFEKGDKVGLSCRRKVYQQFAVRMYRK